MELWALQSGWTNLLVKMAVLEKIANINFKTKIKQGKVFSEEMWLDWGQSSHGLQLRLGSMRPISEILCGHGSPQVKNGWRLGKYPAQNSTMYLDLFLHFYFSISLSAAIRTKTQHCTDHLLICSCGVLVSHFSLEYVLSTDIKCITAYFWRPTSSIYICSGSVRWKRSWVSCPPCTLHDQTKLQQNQNSAWMPMASIGQRMCQMCHMSDTKEYLINPLFREHTVKQNVNSVNSNSFKLLTHTKMIS